MTGLEARGLTSVVDDVVHLKDIRLVFPKGQITTVIGRTLAGKTSLLRGIAGLLERLDGELALDGHDLSARPAWRRNVAMVYQQFINYPHLNVEDNVAFPLRRHRMPADEIRRRVDEALDRVGLLQYRQRKPSELSGGQQQRVALARALSRDVDILLLDEPLVNLDYKLREQLREEFRGLLKSRRDTVVIYTTTDPEEAMLISDQLVVMHEGQVLQAGRPEEIFEQPASATVAGIISDPPMSFLDATLKGDHLDLAGGVRLPAPPHVAVLAPGTYRLGIRAGDLSLGGATVAGVVNFREVTGSETALYLDTACGELTLQTEGVQALSPGARVSVGVPAERLYVFAADSGALMAAPAFIQR
ncbi:ABC transporter ATP-binding protein [Castellaniella sp.]|uniref:ABC transporter ATP-binding protein n=1 Tax=Castellaniella sp. TaxID=1955812 RepID=UPI003C723827